MVLVYNKQYYYVTWGNFYIKKQTIKIFKWRHDI